VEFPVEWPCCIFDMDSVDFSNTLGEQQGNLQISFNIANLYLIPNSTSTSKMENTSNWEMIYLIESIHEKLNKFRPDPQHGKLIRTSIKKIKRQDSIKQYEIIYSINLNKV